MHNISRSLLITFFILGLFTKPIFAQKSNGFYQIHEINGNKLISGIYKTEGFVVKIYTCPFCPEGEECKPCMKDNIVISENNEILDAYSLNKSQLIVFVKDAKEFVLGRKYKFLISLTDYKTTNELTNDVELVECIDCFKK